mmetsp:Transcript_4351/g.7925  ORF Transcript_4351/g.7925 Transcript_4351/m.7925 type:complete len:234 (+) Transcript_4351:1135-1836(+)
MFTEPLFICTLDRCLSYNIEFKSTIPGRLKSLKLNSANLPDVKTKNLAEGVVIRPLTLRDRFLVKRKISNFSEKMYHSGNNNNRNAGTIWGAHGREVQGLVYEIQARLVPARVAAVFSKIGHVELVGRDGKLLQQHTQRSRSVSSRMSVSDAVSLMLEDVVQDMYTDGVNGSPQILSKAKESAEVFESASKLVKEYLGINNSPVDSKDITRSSGEKRSGRKFNGSKKKNKGKK